MLLISLLLLTMLVPAAKAELMAIAEPNTHQQAVDCHESHAVHSEHQHSTDCAESCDCAVTCHANAALSQQHQAATSSIILNTLTALSQHPVSQSPGKFERPPRS